MPMWEAVCDFRDVLNPDLQQSASAQGLAISSYQCFPAQSPDLELLDAQVEDCIQADASEMEKSKKKVRNECLNSMRPRS